MEPIDAAHAVVEEHHPDARAAFLGGSVITDRRTATSDLDIVVLLHGAPAPYRLNVHRHGWPAELLLHTEESWHAFVEREVRNRSSPLMWMCAEGVLLFDRDGVGTRISSHAKSLVAAGPPTVPVEEIEDRRLDATAPGLSKRLYDGVHQALEGRVEMLIEVVDEVLLQAGGRLWVGYRRSGTR
jgi:hypothetical protein